MIKVRAIVVLVIGCMVAGPARAQMDPAFVQQVLEKEAARNTIRLQYPAQVKDFYRWYGYRTAWINDKPARTLLLNYLENATNVGLKQEDYQFGFLESFRNGTYPWQTAIDSLTADFRFTDAAIHFLREVAWGNKPPDIGYNGFNYSPHCLDIPSLLATALSSGRWGSLLQEIELKTPEYLALKNKIILYNKMMRDTAFNEKSRISSRTVSDANRPLVQKLYQLGLIDSAKKKIIPKELTDKIKDAQRLFGLMDDGVLRSTLLNELNVPLATRLIALNRAINTVRWLRCIREQGAHIIVVNIPSATLLLYGRENVTMESKVIVGKKTTRTPTLCSRVHEVVLYPYWMVPKKIATRELLPLIKKDIRYLDANSFQVVNQQGRVVKPSAIDWQALSVNNFPYILRQSTGCDNSLGIVKLNFYSPYTVYLHDTPWKVLFNANKRYFSHGCMRVEKAIELAHFVLKDNTIAIDTLEEKGCLLNQRPIPVPASEKMPVFVLYNTAWVDSSATVRFFEDVYSRVPVKRK